MVSTRLMSWAACARNASSLRAESTQGTVPAPVLVGWSSTSGACSTITWAFVPLMPNDETPARRGRSPDSHGSASVSRETSPAAQSTFGDGLSACRVLGIVPCRMAWTILITPPTPAAACV